ncbi:PhoX family phosphatase [soil metagenome]
MQNIISRRRFLSISAVSVGFVGLQRFAHLPMADFVTGKLGYGPLLKDPEGIFNLPQGFSYKIISRKGDKMNDGFFTPGKPDAMATFSGTDGKVILVRNHEISAGDFAQGPFGPNNELINNIDKAKIYDFGSGEKTALGGTSTLVYNEQKQEVEKQYLSLAGTTRNCAGGLTPWNSWITCEETVERANGIIEKDHGYNFEVPASEDIFLADPVPLTAMGRFNHEAVAVDPKTGIVYQTEDRPDGLIYRFIPKRKGKLHKGGKLQALVLKSEAGNDTRNWEENDFKTTLGKKYQVEWIDLDGIDSPEDDLRYRGAAKGAAIFARGEGMWFGNNECFFACTMGGINKRGQVFRYIPSPFEGKRKEKNSPGILELFVEPNNTELVKDCDNLTIAPWGDLVLCEDHPEPYLVGVTPQGNFYKLGKNIGFKSELAGAVFSPSGKTLFVNIQDPGITLAITGPWNTNL